MIIILSFERKKKLIYDLLEYELKDMIECLTRFPMNPIIRLTFFYERIIRLTFNTYFILFFIFSRVSRFLSLD